MIARLVGRVEGISEGSCVLDVNGVGYLVHASTRTLAALPAGATGTLLIETHVREDAILLYGFADGAERDWFRLLITVQGVGAKLALALLSVLSPADLVGAIQSGDRASLTRVAGVGAKLAVRLLTELREKAGAMPAGTSPPSASVAPAGDAAADALSALLNLGYRRAEAQAALTRAGAGLDAPPPLPVLLRAALRELAPRE